MDNNKTNKKRIEWIDVFKGFLIILMVIGHSNNPYLGSYIYTFHVAAFFFISGYCVNYEKEEFSKFFLNKFKRLIIPFYVFNIVVYFIQFLLVKMNWYELFYSAPFQRESLLNFIKYNWIFDLSGATWFLPILFMALISSKLIYDVIKLKIDLKKMKFDISYLHVAICFILFIAAYFLFYVGKENLAYNMDLIFIGLLFVSIGLLYKHLTPKMNSIKANIIKIITIILYIILVIYDLQQIDIVERILPSIPILLIYIFGGIFILEYISKLISKSKKKNILIYLGKNTLDIMLYHFIGFRFAFCLLYKLNIIEKSAIQSLVPVYRDFWLTLLTAVIGILVSIAIKYFVDFIKKLFSIIIKFVKTKFKLCDDNKKELEAN